MTPKQEAALREYLQEAIVPLIEQVLVKKLGQAMSFAAEELIQPKPASKPLTDAQIGAVAADIWGSILIAPQSYQAFARAIEAAHGITGETK